MFIVSLKIYTDLHQSRSNIPNIFIATEDFLNRSLGLKNLAPYKTRRSCISGALMCILIGELFYWLNNHGYSMLVCYSYSML